ncbi:MAG: secondary thiamine-phosphate synthase enzyme YjbQ [Pseudomonadota bacterium]
METIQVRTRSRVEFVDITGEVREAIARIGTRDGIAMIFVPHTTAGVTINEAADPSVVDDMKAKLADLVPQRGAYRHAEGNSDAHIKATMTGSSAHVIVEEGAPVLGTWQGIFFCEFDGPRNRKVYVKTVS